MRRLEGKNAVITGCNRGIGKAILEAFAREGCNVVACTRSMTDETKAMYDALCTEHNVNIYPVIMDMESEESIKAGIKDIYALKLTIDILVNNAGISNTDGLMRLKISEARRVMQVNFFAPVQLTQGLIRLMMRSKNASIINMGSIAATLPTPGNTVYGASKAALMSASNCWAKELGGLGIRVNSIAPSYITTDMTASIGSDMMASLVGQTALKRMGTPEEIAAGAVFLASDEAKYIDGQTLSINGGI